MSRSHFDVTISTKDRSVINRPRCRFWAEDVAKWAKADEGRLLVPLACPSVSQTVYKLVFKYLMLNGLPSRMHHTGYDAGARPSSFPSAFLTACMCQLSRSRIVKQMQVVMTGV